MTGYLDYSGTDDPPEHTRVLLHFDNGSHLAYASQRLLGKVDWTDDLDDFIGIAQHHLGIDGLSDELSF